MINTTKALGGHPAQACLTGNRRSPRGWMRFALGLLLSMTGCGDPGPKVIPVLGQITYGGGEWPTSGKLYFATVEPAPGTPSRPGMASFEKDGNFVVTTFRDGDGLLPGEYQVSIECLKYSPAMGSFEKPMSHVPDRFQSGTRNGFKIVVPATAIEPVRVQFDVPKK